MIHGHTQTVMMALILTEDASTLQLQVSFHKVTLWPSCSVQKTFPEENGIRAF